MAIRITKTDTYALIRDDNNPIRITKTDIYLLVPVNSFHFIDSLNNWSDALAYTLAGPDVVPLAESASDNLNNWLDAIFFQETDGLYKEILASAGNWNDENTTFV